MLIDTFHELGIKEGDVVFSHVSLGRLGYPEEGKDMGTACRILFEAFREVLGDAGTLLIPTYTYSIGRMEVFDVERTPSTVGPFTEFFRLLPGVLRSGDPMLSVAGIGSQARDLLMNLPHTCYGRDSIYERIRKLNAKILTVGLSLYWATFRHHIEEVARVPFRFSKVFGGYVREKDLLRYEYWDYFAAILQENCSPDGRRLDKKTRESGISKALPLGLSEIVCVNSQDYFRFGLRELVKDPWLTAQGPPLDIPQIISLENRRIGAKTSTPRVSKNSSMIEMIDSLRRLPRDLVSDGYDLALSALTNRFPIVSHEYLTGEKYAAAIIPEKWTCRDAYLQAVKGKGVISYRDNPLFFASYSQPFNGVVDREELLAHTKVHSLLKDAIPYHCLIDQRTWGICVSQDIKETLTAESYRLVIDSAFSFSSLKIGEVVVKGECDDCIMLIAHMDHPMQANDGLSGVAVGLWVMKELMKRKRLRYTYRFLIVPERFGVMAYLTEFKESISSIKSCFLLDMLGHNDPHILIDCHFTQDYLSKEGHKVFSEDEINRVVQDSFGGSSGNGMIIDDLRIQAPFFFLARGKKVKDDSYAHSYPQHHTHLDSTQAISNQRLEESVNTVLSIIDTREDSNPIV